MYTNIYIYIHTCVFHFISYQHPRWPAKNSWAPASIAGRWKWPLAQRPTTTATSTSVWQCRAATLRRASIMRRAKLGISVRMMVPGNPNGLRFFMLSFPNVCVPKKSWSHEKMGGFGGRNIVYGFWIWWLLLLFEVTSMAATWRTKMWRRRANSSRPEIGWG